MKDQFRIAKNAAARALGLGSLAITGAAYAQNGAVGDDRDGAQSAVAPNDIIVTAERRSERLLNVPMSVTALSNEKLTQSGIITTHDLAKLSPTLLFPVNGAFTQISIRGISSTGSGTADASNVAVYVDGVYRPFQPGQLMDLPDVRQVEILKGPQGTLYGQNAAGGAIIISTFEPTFTWTGKLSASYGNFDDVSLRGYVSGPLSDSFAMSIAGSFQDRDGLRRDLLRGGSDSGLNAKLVRAKLLFKPSDAVSITAAGYYSDRADSAAYSGQQALNVPGTALGDKLADLAGLDLPRPDSPREYALNLVPYVKIRSYGASLLGEFDLGAGTLSTVTAFADNRVENFSDIDYTAVKSAEVFFVNPNDSFIQEVNFVSRNFGIMSFAGGLFFKREKSSLRPLFFYLYSSDDIAGYPDSPDPVGVFADNLATRKKSYAAWLEAKADLTDRLTVSLSGRYTSEQLRTSHGVPPAPETPDPRGKFTFEKFTPRATLRYAIGDDSNLYLTYSQGFKSGYVDPRDRLSPPVEPENVYAVEAGYKGRIGDWLSVNLAAFHYDYKNLQVSIYVPPAVVFQNAASARIKGLDLELSAAVSPDLTISAAGVYLDAKYREFPNASAYAPNALGFGYDSVSVDVGGQRMQRAPEFSGNLSVNYKDDIGPGILGAYASVAYSSSIKYDPAGLLKQSAYATVDAELSFEPSSMDGFRFVLWGRNLTDKDYISGILETNFALGVGYAPPRTYGARVEFSF